MYPTLAGALTLTFMGDNPLPAPSEIYANKIYVVRNGTSDDGKVIACLWNGTVFEWKDLAMTAEGTAGPPGPEGPKGDTGDQGPAGSKGEDGAQGIQGLEGSAGPKGDKGDKGDQGNVGLQGAQGLQGSPGVDGEDGAPGPQGSQGIQGLTGLPGDQGPQGQQGIQGVQGPQGDAGVSNYTINVQALTSSPTDAQTVYFGKLPKAPVTVAATSKIYIRKAGTIKIAEIYCYSGTPGTAEAWSLYIRKNNTTDYLIATLSVSASERVFSNAALSIAVAVGDYIEIKGIQPTWATNPLTTIYGGYIYIE